MNARGLDDQGVSVPPPAAGDGKTPPWRMPVILWAFFLLIQLVLLFRGGIVDIEFVNPDSYMRLNRVVQLHENGDWTEARYERINPPAGHEQHWTRPMDALLLGISAPLSPVLGFRGALHQAGIWVNVLLFGATLALYVAFARRLDAYPEAPPILGLLLVVQPVAHLTFAMTNPDHQGLLFLANAAAVLSAGMILLGEGRSTRHAVLAGTASALALWVSVESMLVIAVICTALGLGWLGGRDERAASGTVYSTTLALLVWPVLVLEQGADFSRGMEIDQPSLLFAHCLLALAVIWAGLWLSTRLVAESVAGRFVATLVVVAVVGGAFVAIDGTALFDPLAEVNPLYERTRLANIIEYKGMDKAIEAVVYLGLPAVATLYGLFHLLRRRRHPELVLMSLLGMVVFAALTIHQLHWAPYCLLFALVPYTIFCCEILQPRANAAPSHRGTVLNALLLMTLLGWPVALAISTIALPEDESVRTATREDEACPIREIASTIDAAGDGEILNVMAYVDYGPEILYRTRHAVYSIPNHRPQPGYTLTYETMSAREDDEAARMLRQADVDLLLVCITGRTGGFYQQTGVIDTFHGRLVDRAPPPWLEPVALPEGLESRFKLFRVR